jgi:hypothetical protein
MHAIARAGVFMISFFYWACGSSISPSFILALSTLYIFVYSKFHNGIQYLSHIDVRIQAYSNLHPYYTVLPRTALCMVCKYCDRSIKMLQKGAFLRSVHYESCVV